MSSEFPKVPLGHLTINYDSKRRPVKSSDRKSGPYPYYGASGIVDYVDGYIFDGEYLLVGEDGENMRTRQTPIAFLAKGKFWVNNHAHIVRGNGNASTKYLKYALAVTDISAYLTGAVMPKLTQGNLNKIPIPCPAVEVQDGIVRLLGSLDDSIDTLQHQNTTLEAIAQRLFRSWFVNFDPVHAKAAGREPEAMSAELAALFPSEFEESVLGLIPKGWSAPPYSENIVIHSGGTPKTSMPEYWNGDIPWFSVTDAPAAGQVFVLKTEKHITKAGLANSPARLLPHRSTIISARGTVGKIGMVGGVMSINQSCYALSPSGNHGNYWVYFQTKELVSQLKQMAHGGVFDTITRDTFKGVKVAIPSEQIFESFSRVCRPLFDAIECNGQLSQRLTELRDHLLPRLISGKLSLADAEAALAAVKPEVEQA